MDSLKSLRVNLRALLMLARQNDWFFHFWAAVSKDAIGSFKDTAAAKAFIETLPSEMNYLELRPYLSGKALLDAIECLVGVDHRVAGMVLAAMAREMFLPHVPADHPAQQPSIELLNALMDYLLKKSPAEIYIGKAFCYRIQYGTTRSSAGTDTRFELLFEAMPSNGLCCPIGEGRWHLGMHWDSFGRYLACQRDGWQLLDAADAELDDCTLVDDDPVADREAADRVRSMVIDPLREAMTEGELDDLEGDLCDLIDRVLPAAVSVARVEA